MSKQVSDPHDRNSGKVNDYNSGLCGKPECSMCLTIGGGGRIRLGIISVTCPCCNTEASDPPIVDPPKQ